jgi:hypothetical protein
MSPYIETTNKEKCMKCDKLARFKGVTIPYGVYFAYCKDHLKELLEK